METINTETPKSTAPPTAPPPAPQVVQLAIVNLGSAIFHNKWFHSAAVGPAEDKDGNVIDADIVQLKIKLVSPAGMGEGFTFRGTHDEIVELYQLLQKQVGTIPMTALHQGPTKPAPKEESAEVAPLELVRPDKGEKDASEQDRSNDEA